jgi:hypothetical protein
MHKFHCHYCSIFLFGDTAQRLANFLNEHNDKHHPDETNNWTGLSVIHSTYYVAPLPSRALVRADVRALPRYTEPHGLTTQREWGNAERAPVITEADREMLKKALVKW